MIEEKNTKNYLILNQNVVYDFLFPEKDRFYEQEWDYTFLRALQTYDEIVGKKSETCGVQSNNYFFPLEGETVIIILYLRHIDYLT